jgi:nitroreductase
MKNIIESLQWRYATKKFDTTKKLTPAQLDMLLTAARLSPSSFGLQPWKFVIVTDPAVRAKLREAAWGQSQITDASALIVFCVRKNIDDALVDTYMQSIATTRNVPLDSLKGFADSIKGSINSRATAGSAPEAATSAAREWASRQVYIALGVLLTTAAHLDIDACPMEGFDPQKFDDILGLAALGLESRVLAAVGFRSADDTAAGMEKVRFPKEEVVVEVKEIK